MRVLGFILIFGGLVAAGQTAIIGKGYFDSVRAHEAEIARLDAEHDSLVAERTEASLSHRATMESIHSQPDSIRMQNTAKISMRLRDLDRAVRWLSNLERENRRLERREHRLMAEEADATRRRAIPWGVGSVVLVAAGVVMVVVAARQRA